MSNSGTALRQEPTTDNQGLQAAALASVANAVMITTADGVIVWVNQAFTEMSGYAPDEALGHTPRLLRSGAHDQRHYAQLWATILDGRTWRGDVVERHKNGELYTVTQTITPLLDADGAPSHFVAVHEDVTQLRSSQARLQSLFDHALDAILLFDDDGALVDANPAVCLLTGYSRGQMAGMAVADLIPAAGMPGFERDWARLMAEGHARGSSPVVRSDGGLIEVDYQAVAAITSGVNMLIARDVTAQRRAEADQRFQSQLLAAVGDAVVATDLDGMITYWSPAAERVYGWSADEAHGRAITDLTVGPGSLEDPDAIMARLRGGEAWTEPFEVRRRDGTTFPALVTNAPYFDPAGDLTGIIGVSTDISELKRAEQLLTHRTRQQGAVAELGQRALTVDDPHAVGLHAEEKVAEVLGDGFHAHIDWTARSGDAPEGPSHGAGETQVAVGTSGLLRVRHPDDAPLAPADREFIDAVAHVVHATVQRDTARARLAHLATHDPLTGLPNRTLFLDRLEQARLAATRSGDRFAVVFLDLDGFKFINDGLGHDSGDEILRLVADRLTSVVRPADTVARFGGDEFAVLCPGLSGADDPTAVTDRIQAALDAGFVTGETKVAVTASIGTVIGDSASQASALLREADTAMYWAKDNGRNRTERFDTRMQEQALHRFDITAALRDALEAGGITVLYQPSVALTSGRIVGVEALARLELPTGEVVRPDHFIWVAEEAGLIAALGQQVLERACADASAWLAVDPDFTVAVNLSPRQLAHPSIAGTVAQALADADLAPGSLWLEITESAMLSDAGVDTALHELRALGVKLAIDDFGTGYSSLAHLRQMPVHSLKIDRSFVGGLNVDGQDRALVAAAIDLAHTFSLSTTAEGVETPEQCAELSSLGCEFGQGYLWSPPVSAEEITRMLPPESMGA